MSKYDEVLLPFKRLMETELHANAAKGDRPGWLSMTAEQCLLEIYYHVSKLQKAVRDGNGDRIKENTADVANMAMMLADICGALDLAQPSDGALTNEGAEPVLSKPAKVGSVRFGKGIKERLVIEAAQRHFEYALQPEVEEDRIERLRATIAAVHAPSPASVVPEGWKLVPVEPTDDMIVAFAETGYSKRQAIDDPDMLDAYADMLAAAPASTESRS